MGIDSRKSPAGDSLATAVDPEGEQFFAGTYQLRLSVKRDFGDVLNVNASILGTPFKTFGVTSLKATPHV